MKHLPPLPFFILVFGLLFSTSLKAGPIPTTHPFGWEDIFSMVRLSNPQPSPDGKWILFHRKAYDVEKNKGNSDIALIGADGNGMRGLTSDPATDVNGRWLPDGSAILFLSDRGGSMQIHRLSLQGGEPEKVTSLDVDIDGFELSPDGKRALFIAGVFPDCKDLACTSKRLKETEESKVKAMTFDRLFIRHWDTWNDGRRNHLLVLDLSTQKTTDLMAGLDQDAPRNRSEAGEEFAWSPDGKWVAYTSKPSAGEAWHTNSEIYLLPSDGSAKAINITAGNDAVDTNPVFSPDGKRIVYLAMDRGGDESDRKHLVLYDVAAKTKKSLTEKWDRSVDSAAWSPDGKTLYVSAGEHARSKIFSVDATSGQVRSVIEQGVNSDLRVTKSGGLVFLQQKMTQPNEVYTFDPATSRGKIVSRVNQDRLSHIRFGAPEEFWFDHDKMKIRAWIVKPVDFVAGKKYPLAFLIHGGPQGSWEDGFHYRWNLQFPAGAGYVVMAVDFRGSTGYGQAFTDAIRGNWGPGPYSDLIAGVNEALKKYSFIDKDRMCALGASYGGYMINWIAGENHPFKCLVNHDGDFDTSSSYFNTEELWFPDWEMTGPPWEKRDIFEKNSPMLRIGKWKTPMLVIHGSRDFRVNEAEGFSTFNALQRRGIPSKFLYFPDENHWVLKPQNSRLWHSTVLGWLDRWTQTTRKK